MPSYFFSTSIAIGEPGQVDWANAVGAALNEIGPLLDAAVKLTGNQTVAGVKTFSSAPVVPDSSFTIAKVSGLQAALDGKATTAQGAKADTAVQPATLSSYVPTTRTVAGKALSANITLNADDIADGTTNRVFTAAEKSKLSGVAAGATANDTDANLKNRANHTGTQTSASISDFAEAVRDTVGTALVAGANVTIDVNDAADTITISSAGSGGGSVPADSSVSTAKIVDGAVTSVKIADGAVTSSKIADGTIVDADISPSAAIAQSKISGLTSSLSAKAPTADPTFTGTVSGVTKAHVGLSNVDNTSDASKPISTATQAALDAKVPTTRTVAGKALSANITLAKADVGLSNVDNTSDASKPISTATQTALDAKAPLDGANKLPLANLPSGTTVTVYGDVARPTARTDIIIQWVHSSLPAAFNSSVDIWLNI